MVVAQARKLGLGEIERLFSDATKNRVHHARMQKAGWRTVGNTNNSKGDWRVRQHDGTTRRKVVYVQQRHSNADACRLASELCERGEQCQSKEDAQAQADLLTAQRAGI
jgi:hypothetical protein